MEVNNLLQVQPTYKTPVRIFFFTRHEKFCFDKIDQCSLGKDATDVSANLPKDTNQYKQDIIGTWNSPVLTVSIAAFQVSWAFSLSFLAGVLIVFWRIANF